MSVIDRWLEDFEKAVESIVTEMMTFWIKSETRSIETSGDGTTISTSSTPVAPHGTSSQISEILGWVTWVGFGVAVLSLMILGAMLAIARSRGEGGQYLGRIVIVIGAVILISGAASMISFLLGTIEGPSAGGAAGFLQSRLFFYVGAMAIVSVIIAGIKMAWEQRADPGKELLKSLLTLLVVATASVAFINAAITLADEFSLWIIEEAVGESDIGVIVTSFLAVTGMAALKGAPGGFVVVILLGLIIVIAGLLQMVVMMIRDGMLILLAGVLPLTAAFTNTQMGKQWFQKAIGWLVAFLLYKPVAAIIYALVFVLLGYDQDAPTQAELYDIVLGLTMMLLAIFALPALMKFVTPMVGATAGGAMGAGVASSLADNMPSGSSGGGSSGGGGSGGGRPTGNSGGGFGSSAAGGMSGGAAAGGGSAASGGAAAGGGAMAGGGAAVSGAGSAAMKSNPKTAAIYAAAKAVKAVAQKTQQGMNDAVGGEGGDGPSGSKR